MGARGGNGFPWRVVNARVGAELSTGDGQLMRGRAGSEQPRKNMKKIPFDSSHERSDIHEGSMS